MADDHHPNRLPRYVTTPETIPGADQTVRTAFVPVEVIRRWTFKCKHIRNWVEGWLPEDGSALNACAGEVHLSSPGCEIIRNDSEPARPADYHLDVAQLASVFARNKFSVIIFDGPWSLYQANLRYNGNHVYKDDVKFDPSILPFDVPDQEQIGHARLAKEGFNYLLRPGGVVIQLAYTASCMPKRMGFDQLERVAFGPTGRYNAVIGSVDRKHHSSQRS